MVKQASDTPVHQHNTREPTKTGRCRHTIRGPSQFLSHGTEQYATSTMTTAHPGFERSLPDEDVQAKPVASDKTTQTHQASQQPALHHHRCNAVAIPVSELPALRGPPSRPLPLTRAASQYAEDDATSAHRSQMGFLAPTITLTAPHGITEAVLSCFGEDTPLLRSVTPEAEAQPICDGGPGMANVIADERSTKHEHEVAIEDDRVSPSMTASSLEHFPAMPGSLIIVGTDENSEEHKVTFVDIPTYIFEYFPSGKGFGARANVVIELEHGRDADADTNVSDSDSDSDSDSAGDLDPVIDGEKSSDESEMHIRTLSSDVSSTSSSTTDYHETNEDAERLQSNRDEMDVENNHQNEVPLMFTYSKTDSDGEGHVETQGELSKPLPVLAGQGPPSAILSPRLSRTALDHYGLVLRDEIGNSIGIGLHSQEHRLQYPWWSNRHIVQENGATSLLFTDEGSMSDGTQGIDSNYSKDDTDDSLHDHETISSSCPTVEWIQAFAEIVGVERHLPRCVHQLRGEWPGHWSADEGSSLVGKHWREWRIGRRRTRSLLRDYIGSDDGEARP